MLRTVFTVRVNESGSGGDGSSGDCCLLVWRAGIDVSYPGIALLEGAQEDSCQAEDIHGGYECLGRIVDEVRIHRRHGYQYERYQHCPVQEASVRVFSVW